MAASAQAGSASNNAPGGRTIAQWFALVGGAVLVLVGIVGFIADATFQFGTPHESGQLLGIFEVNAIHNLVHIATGALLLAGAPRADLARVVVLAFAGAYAVVTIIGLIQGNTVLGIIPINAADNVLHIVLTLAAAAAGLVSPSHVEPETARAGDTRRR